jgi:hypothetical protein
MLAGTPQLGSLAGATTSLTFRTCVPPGLVNFTSSVEGDLQLLISSSWHNSKKLSRRRSSGLQRCSWIPKFRRDLSPPSSGLKNFGL